MMTQHKTQTPTETIQKWISDFVTQPNPIFGNLPPCPFAQKAIIDGKVEFSRVGRRRRLRNHLRTHLEL